MEKLIGTFSEMDGMETTNISDMIEKLGVIGSLSADAGNIELYYDKNGITYAVAHDSEKYYGVKYDLDANDYKFVNKKTNKTEDATNLRSMLKTIGCTCNHVRTTTHDDTAKCVFCLHRDNPNYAIDRSIIAYIKQNGYDVFKLE